MKKNKYNQLVMMFLSGLIFTLSLLGHSAHAFEFKDTNAQAIKISDYKGKWVLVNFWATWCGPCLDEIPDLIDLHKAHKDKDLIVLGVMMDYESAQDPAAFIEKMKIVYPVIPGTAEATSQFRDVSMLPVSYLYDKKGNLVEKHFGSVSREGLEDYIRNFSRKKKPSSKLLRKKAAAGDAKKSAGG